MWGDVICHKYLLLAVKMPCRIYFGTSLKERFKLFSGSFRSLGLVVNLTVPACPVFALLLR